MEEQKVVAISFSYFLKNFPLSSVKPRHAFFPILCRSSNHPLLFFLNKNKNRRNNHKNKHFWKK